MLHAQAPWRERWQVIRIAAISNVASSAIDAKGSPSSAKCCRNRSATSGNGGSEGVTGRIDGTPTWRQVGDGLIASAVVGSLLCWGSFVGVSNVIGLFRWTDFDCRSKQKLAAREIIATLSYCSVSRVGCFHPSKASLKSSRWAGFRRIKGLGVFRSSQELRLMP